MRRRVRWRRTENRDRCFLFLSQTFFETTNFVKHRGVPLRNVWVLGDKTISTENRDTSLLYIKFFHTRMFLNHRKVPLRKLSLLWAKQFRWKIVIILLPPPTSPLSSIKTFDTWKFLKHRRGPLQHFWHCETKQFPPKIVIAPDPVILETFRYRNHNETQEYSSTTGFGTGTQNIFGKKSQYSSPHSLIHRNFQYRKFLKHRRVALRNDSVLWDKKLSTEIVIPPFNPWINSITECFWNTGGLLYEMIRYCGTKYFRRKSWYPLLIHESFPYQNASETQKGSYMKSFDTVGKTVSKKNRDISPPPNYP